MRAHPVTLFLCGDVMLGRGVDQILPHPGDPRLSETFVRDARDYIRLAEETNGPIPRPVEAAWPWGDALAELDRAAPDVRVVNLETSVTRSDDAAPGKPVRYRMSPANLPSLGAARPDACALANNHVLDFGREGLAETLEALRAAGLRSAGAGRDAEEARRPAVIPRADGGRVLVVSFAMPSSGVPAAWAATSGRSGVDLVTRPSTRAAARVAERVQRVKRDGDVAVASVHWGSNWGYDIAAQEVDFAHALVEGGVDIVHGHSSHHPRPVEVYRGRLVLYGCGDLVNDYEGIGGYAEFRDDLRLLYLVTVEPDSGRLLELRMPPMRARRMRLEHAAEEEARWLRATLDHASSAFGTRIGRDPDGALALRPE